MSTSRGRARELAAAALDTDEFRATRWLHVQSVGAAAERIAAALDEETGGVLVAAAWLHDVGYGAQARVLGFHPVDGARWLREQGVEHRVCALVAHHSGALVEAQLRGLAAEMTEWPDEGGVAADGLWCCDMTTSPTGVPVTFDTRLAEIVNRYGAEHTVSRAITMQAPRIRRAVERCGRLHQTPARTPAR